MATVNLGVIMNGVTGRMGTNQHLIRSIMAIRSQGGVALPNGDVIMPDPLLVGRQESKLRALAESNGLERWSTDLDACLADPYYQIYFDSQTTDRRVEGVRKAIAAGKHIYCEKPTAGNLAESLELARLARERGVKNGVVQDKLFLPGLIKLIRLIDSGYFGRILSVRMEFGYWVFEGDMIPCQRPSWNYRKEDGGGIIVDMFAHWRYVLDNLFGKVRSVSCLGATHIPERYDERNEKYSCTAEDAAYATFEIEGGIVAQANSSWAVRVNRDELVNIQVDGTNGSAAAGLRNCKTQHKVNTPKPVWNPDIPSPYNFLDQWEPVPDNQVFDNGFKMQWELFLKHVACGTPFPWDLLEGAKGTQLAELGLQSWKERRWIDIPDLTL
ncbi:Gfo/Idh/MocA family protein [Paenibacillus humicola]|uniref:Gfo/Idh/MocA family protein n=1 Tax=Paenibacillus humicola TaxID=3110540 RepID=UPI00237A0D43|nr:Gfo/Idh/MocA family oxidoreductase [Paenibacillus humicola]